MFDRHCTACDRTQLIFPSQIQGVTNTDHGILVGYVYGAAPSRPGSPAPPATSTSPPSPPPDRSREPGDPDAYLDSARLWRLRYPRRVARTPAYLIGTPTVREARRLSSVGRAIHS